MAPTLKATPNPVLIKIGQVTGASTISWDGAETGPSRLFEVVGATEQLVAPPGGGGLVVGSTTVNIGLGAHLYRLRPVAGGNVPIASLTVTVQHASEAALASVQDGLSNTSFFPIQAITRVSVKPASKSAVFTFRTTVATVPIVNITLDDPDTGTLIASRFPVFGGSKTEHVIDVDRLPQGKTLFFKIIAGNPMLWSSPSAVLRGSFKTARVDAQIIFDRIIVISDSDKLSKGDLTFKFFAGDAETMSDLPVAEPVHKETLGDGETAFIGQSIDIQAAPARLWVEVQCRDNDLFPIPFPGEGLSLVGTKPGTGPASGFTSTDNYDYAHVRDEFETLENGVVHPGVLEIPFTMKTGNFPLAFEVFGRLRLKGSRGIGFRTDPAIPFNPGSAFSQVSILAAGPGGAKTMMAALGPDGEVHLKVMTPDAPRPTNEWIGLGGRFVPPLTAIEMDETTTGLFAADAGGAHFYRLYSEGDSTDDDWHPLGGPVLPPLVMTQGPRNRVELFGVDREGNVHHHSFDRRSRADGTRDWVRIGGEVAGSLAPVYSPTSGLTLFALGRNGHVLYKHRHDEKWRPEGIDWESLGGRFRGAPGARPVCDPGSQGLLTARLQPDGSLMLVVISPDRAVHMLHWREYPERPSGHRWEKVGTIDSLFESIARESASTRAAGSS